MDRTGLAIILGAVGAAAYSAIAVRSGRFSLSKLATVVTALYVIPLGMQLVMVAYGGRVDELPERWREFVALAGIIGIGLAAKAIFGAFLGVK